MHGAEQLPNLIDRAIRIALQRGTPDLHHLPSDVFDLEYEAPEHAFKQVPSSLGLEPTRGHPGRQAVVRQAADLLNAGERVAMLVGQGARDCVDELTQVAELLGAGAAKACWARTCCPTTCRG